MTEGPAAGWLSHFVSSWKHLPGGVMDHNSVLHALADCFGRAPGGRQEPARNKGCHKTRLVELR